MTQRSFYGCLNPQTGSLFLIENPGNFPTRQWDTDLETEKLAKALLEAKAEGAGKVAIMPPGLPDLMLARAEVEHTYVNGSGDAEKPRIWVTSRRWIEIVSNGDIDADGSPRAKEIDPPWGQVPTSFSRANGWTGEGQYPNSENIPYIVLPLEFADRLALDSAFRPKLGDLCRVSWKGNSVFAIFADEGPKDLLGEMSIAAAEALGFNPWNEGKTKLRGVGIGYGVTYEIIPRTFDVSHAPPRPTTFQEIQELGRMLFDAATPIKYRFQKKGILLNPGHGKASGALGKNKSITESELNWLQVERISARFHEAGLPHLVMSQDEVGGSLQKLGQACADYDLGLFCHHNAWDGVEHYTCCMRQDGGLRDAEEHELAKRIAASVAAALKNPLFKPDGVMKTALTVNRYAHSVGAMGILTESSFVDDETDEAEARKEALIAAEAIASAVIQFFRA